MSQAARAVLDELRALDVEVVVAGDKLRFKPPGAVTPDLRQRMKEEKDALLDLLLSAAKTAPTSGELAAVQRRLAALLKGRLWRDSGGTWPKGTRFAPSNAKRVAAEAMLGPPPADLPAPTLMTEARGLSAVRAWGQVVGCLITELGWSVERAAGAAAYVVDPCFTLPDGGEDSP